MAATFVAVGASGCEASAAPDGSIGASAQTIVHGTMDDIDPAVVGIAIDDTVICTGTLIAPRVVVTAAHCFGEQAITNVAAVFGASPAAGHIVAVDEVRLHYAFDPVTLQHDIALLWLGESDADRFASIEAKPLAPTFVGQVVRVVGFGVSSNDADNTEPKKRDGTSIVDGYNPSTFSLRPDPAQPCFGDSGGPVFMPGAAGEELVGVTSHGDAACADHAVAVRVDAYTKDFIEPYLREMSAGDSMPIEGTIACTIGRAASDQTPTTTWLLGVAVVALLARAGARQRR